MEEERDKPESKWEKRVWNIINILVMLLFIWALLDVAKQADTICKKPIRTVVSSSLDNITIIYTPDNQTDTFINEFQQGVEQAYQRKAGMT